MKKLKKYIVVVNYENESEIFRGINAYSKQEAILLVIDLFITKNDKYTCRPLNSYKFISCLNNNDEYHDN